MDFFIKLKTRNVIFLVVLLYVIWSILFIIQSSVVAIDGKRYFSLFDDAMISMRYAWNFSHGHGLVWNPGERVEGYTNLLMTLIMSIYTGLFQKSDAALAVQITGLGVTLGCSFFVWKLGDFFAEELEEGARSFFKVVVLIMTLAYYPLSFWSLTGMETGLLTLLMLASLYVTEKYLREKSGFDLLLVAGLQGLAYLTRPDAIIFSVPIFLYIIYMAKQDLFRGRSQLTAMFFPLAFYFLFIIGQEMFRINFYREYLPNTYYLKLTGMPLADRIANGLGFIKFYLLTHLFLLVIAIRGYIVKPESRRGLYLLLVSLPILYQIWVGGESWPYWRIMTPVQPILALLFALSAYELVARIRRPVSLNTRLRWASYMIVFGILFSNFNFIGEAIFLKKPYDTEFYEPFINTALVLDEITTEDATVGVFTAGTIPYYSERKAIDFLGKNDPYIARLPPDLSGKVSWNGMYSVPGHNKYDLNYSIKQLFPTYIQSPVWKGQDLSSWASDHYVVVHYRGVGLYLKKGAPEVKWELLSP